MAKLGTTKYYEAYAKELITDMYKVNILELELGESPDIQDRKNSIGIEVTRSSSDQKCICDSIMRYYFNKGLSKEEIEENIKRKYKCFEGELGTIGTTNYISPSKGLVDFKEKIDLIIKRIADKNFKLNNKYDKFSENDLYIFSENSCINIEDINEIIKSDEYKNSDFDKIYIDCIDKIFICSGKKINIVNINTDQIKKYKKRALEYKKEK